MPPSLLLSLFFLASIPAALYISSCSPSLPLPIFLWLPLLLLPSFFLTTIPPPFLYFLLLPQFPVPFFPPASIPRTSYILPGLHPSHLLCFLLPPFLSLTIFPPGLHPSRLLYVSCCLHSSRFFFLYSSWPPSLPLNFFLRTASIPPTSYIPPGLHPSLLIFSLGLPLSLLLPIFLLASIPPSYYTFSFFTSYS